VKKQFHRGFSLIDMMLSVAVTIIFTMIFIGVIKRVNDGRIASKEASIMSGASEGLYRYMQKNRDEIKTGVVSGFVNALNPTRAELIDKGYLAPSMASITPFGGQINFSVRMDTNGAFMGLVCDLATITQKGEPSNVISNTIASLVDGGVSTSIATPAILNGSSYQNIPSDIANPSMLCAIKTLPG